VLITEETHKAVEGFFETRDLGRIAVKGHEPVHAFEVQRTRGSRSRIEIGRERGLTPFVGRVRELGLLVDRFREPVAGRVQVVFVAGEAGIGKSRLLHEFRQAIMEVESSATWLEGQCVSFGQSIPFLSVVDLLRKDFAIEEFDGEPEIVFKFRHSDLQTAANLDVRPNTAGDHRIKFKAEALPLNNVLGGFRLLYSHTAEFALREMTSGDRATLGKLSHLFPCLATLRAGHDDRLDLVNQMIVEEVLFDLSRLDFGKGIEAKTNAAL
jgi:hypothetical protein